MIMRSHYESITYSPCFRVHHSETEKTIMSHILALERSWLSVPKVYVSYIFIYLYIYIFTYISYTYI